MSLPPPPEGAVPLNSNLPPLPKGATPISGSEWDSNEPVPEIKNVKAPQKLNFADKVVENLPAELFQHPHPTAQLAIGAMKPFAGLAEYGGITAPAEVLNRLSKRFEEGPSSGAAKALDVTGQVLPIGATTRAISEVPQVAQYLSNAQYLPKIADFAQKVAKASPFAKYASMGAGQSALAPVTTPENQNQSYSDMLGEKLLNTGTGAVVGGSLGKLSQAVLNPRVAEKVQMLKDFGMKNLTPGQLLGFPEFEKKLTSLPISGWLINKELENVNQEMNKSVANKALSHIGEKLPKDVKAGTDMMEHLQNKVNESYDNIADKIHFIPTKNTIPNLTQVSLAATKNLTPAERETFNSIVKDKFFEPLIGEGSNYELSGHQFRDIESTIGTIAHRLSTSTSASERGVGYALLDFQQGLRKELAEINPAHAKELHGIHDFFKDYLRINKASGSAGAVSNRNVFNPAQLLASARGMSTAAQKGSSSGRMMSEAQDIQDVLGKAVPDSGTAGRVGVMGALTDLAAHGTTGAAGGLPGLAIPALMTGAVYNPLSRKLINTVATGERPEAVKATQPAVSGALSQVGSALSSQSNESP